MTTLTGQHGHWLAMLWLVAGLLFGMPSHVSGQAVAWRVPHLIEKGCGSPREPSIAIAGRQVVAVWGRSATRRIEASASSDGGATWQTPRVIDDGTGAAATPQMSMAGLRVVAVWSQQEGPTNYIAANYSEDGGTSWGKPRRLSAPAARADGARVVLSGSQTVAAWVQEEAGAISLLTACSFDGGTVWESAQTISAGSGRIADPYLAVSGARVLAIWGRDNGAGMDLLSSCSEDGGRHWAAPQLLEKAPGRVHAGVSWVYCPQAALSGSNAAAIWIQDEAGRPGIFVNNSTDGGQTWAGARLLEYSPAKPSFPHIAMSGKTAVAVWICWNPWASYSTDGGITWQKAQLLRGGRFADNPAVAISGSRAMVAWRQHDGTALSVFSNVSEDGGKTWQIPQQLDTSSAMAWYPQVAIDGVRAAAVWMQLTLDWNWSLFASHSVSGGQRWQSPSVVAAGAGDPGKPVVALSANRSIALWPCFEQEKWSLRVAFSEDRGDTWKPATFASPGASAIDSAVIAMDGARAIAAWRQYDDRHIASIAAACSADGGATWQAIKTFSAMNGREPAVPSATVSESVAMVAWRNGSAGKCSIDAARSGDGGKNWTEPQTLSADALAAEPQVAAVGQQVVATWIARDGGQFALWAVQSGDGGKRWSKPAVLQRGIINPGCPRIAVAGSRSAVVWRQADGAVNRIFASISGDGGRTWSGPAPVEIGFGNAWNPNVAFVGERIVVTWFQRQEQAAPLTEYSHQSMQNTQYGCYSADGGKTWSSACIIANGFGESVVPAMTLDGSHALAGYLSNDGSLWTLYANDGAFAFTDGEGIQR